MTDLKLVENLQVDDMTVEKPETTPAKPKRKLLRWGAIAALLIASGYATVVIANPQPHENKSVAPSAGHSTLPAPDSPPAANPAAHEQKGEPATPPATAPVPASQQGEPATPPATAPVPASQQGEPATPPATAPVPASQHVEPATPPATVPAGLPGVLQVQQGPEYETIVTRVPPYTAEGKRDPFRSLLGGKEVAAEVGAEPSARPLTPLEQYELLSLKLTGTMKTPAGVFALVKAPDGKGYTVQTGMYMGKNSGRVVQIDLTELVVEEKYKTPRGEIETQRIPLILREVEE